MKEVSRLILIIIVSALLTSASTSVSTRSGDYDPWCDLDDDGDIDIFDIVVMAGIYGSEGESFPLKAALAYDSSWIDITEMQGQYFNVTHNLNLGVNQSFMPILSGKVNADSTPHWKYWYGFGLPGWNQTYGGTSNDYGISVVQTGDGGYVIAGATYSFGAGDMDVWLVRTDALGNHVWNQTYGGVNIDYGVSVVQTGDGGYAISGDTYSFGAGNSDFWLIKTDGSGNHQWNQTYGGTDGEYMYSVVQTGDGGYALAGATESFGAGNGDAWLVKTDTSGNHQWNQTYGGTSNDYVVSLVQTVDGGYVIAGVTNSFGAGSNDFWLIKTDGSGNHQWNQTYGGTSSDDGRSVVQTSDGGYAITGYTESLGAGGNDVWLVKTDTSGNHQWNHTYGGTDQDYGYSVVQIGDGGYAITGYTNSFGAGGYDVWLVKTDTSGNHLWNQTYGGTSSDSGRSVVQTSDGGYAITGHTNSLGSGGADTWLVKTDAFGLTELELGLTITDSDADTLTLYRGINDPYWNYLRVVIWVVKDSP